MKLKITKTLLEGWAYMFGCAEGNEDEAYAEFVRTLNREPLEENEAIRNGKAFEELCYRMAQGRQAGNAVKAAPTGETRPTAETVDGEAALRNEYPKWYDGAKKISEIIKDAQFQVPVGCDMQAAGQTFWLYGICDAVKAGVIYDVKFRTKSLSADDVYGKYRDCSQHSLYLKAFPEAVRFEYLVSDGTDLYTEAYDRETSKPVGEHITNFWAWLHTRPELLKTYKERWAVG